jgi:thiamine-monophosphate kinase
MSGAQRTGADAEAGAGATVGGLGEFSLLARIAGRFAGAPSPYGPGDDAAVVATPDGRVVATTDLLAEDVHFRFAWSSPYDVGRKAATANLADVAAMGAVPTALLVGMALPAETPLATVDGIVDGIRDECAPLGARVVGGDVIAAADRVTLAVSALGDLQGRDPVTRRASEAGRLVVVGRLGWAAAGLALLRAGVEDARFAPLLEAHRRPQPPYRAGPALALAGALAMCDVSDGLLGDLRHLVESSDGGAEVDTALLPRDPLLDAAGAQLGIAVEDWLLSGGDDHALLAVLPPGTGFAGGCDIGWLRPGTRAGVRVLGWDTGGREGHAHFGGGPG